MVRDGESERAIALADGTEAYILHIQFPFSSPESVEPECQFANLWMGREWSGGHGK